jgi:predicted ATPase
MREDTMNIVFSGSSGSGKTTLLNGLLERANSGQLAFPLPHVLYSQTQDVYNRWGLYTEYAGVNALRETIKSVQYTLFNDRVDTETLLVNQYGGFISDRSLIDIYVYTLLKCYPVLSQWELQHLEGVALCQHNKYTIVFLCEDVKDILVQDEFRSRSYVQEYLFLLVLKNYYMTHNLSYVYVQNEPRDTRIDFVCAYIQQWRHVHGYNNTLYPSTIV